MAPIRQSSNQVEDPVRSGINHNTVQRVLHAGALRARSRGWDDAVKLKAVSEQNVQGSFCDLKVNLGEPWWQAEGKQEQPGPEE